MVRSKQELMAAQALPQPDGPKPKRGRPKGAKDGKKRERGSKIEYMR